MTGQTEDLVIQQGKTFQRIVRWETTPLVYKAITAITKAGPVQITAASHGIPAGWRAAVVSAGGMRQINAKNWPLRDSDFHQVTVSDANTVTLNDVNSADYTTYTSGGYLVYYTPVSLSGFTARMQIRATQPAATALDSLTSPTDIALDDAAKAITITIPAADTAAYTWLDGVYDLELVSSGGVVTQLLRGSVTVEPEVTR